MVVAVLDRAVQLDAAAAQLERGQVQEVFVDDPLDEGLRREQRQRQERDRARTIDRRRSGRRARAGSPPATTRGEKCAMNSRQQAPQPGEVGAPGGELAVVGGGDLLGAHALHRSRSGAVRRVAQCLGRCQRVAGRPRRRPRRRRRRSRRRSAGGSRSSAAPARATAALKSMERVHGSDQAVEGELVGEVAGAVEDALPEALVEREQLGPIGPPRAARRSPAARRAARCPPVRRTGAPRRRRFRPASRAPHQQRQQRLDGLGVLGDDRQQVQPCGPAEVEHLRPASLVDLHEPDLLEALDGLAHHVAVHARGPR